MKKTLIWEGLHGLTKRELDAFLRFIHSPYFNVREDLIALGDFLLSEEVLARDDLSKKEVFYQVYPASMTYNDQKMRLLLSYLQKQFELFISMEELKKQPAEASWLLLEGLKHRNLAKNYSKKLKHCQIQFEKRDQKDWAYYFGKYRLGLQSWYLAQSRGEKFINHSGLIDSLDRFYLTAKLRVACSALFYKSVHDSNYEFPLLDNIMSIASQERFLRIPSISIYYHFIKMMQGGDEKVVERLDDGLFTQKNNFSDAEFEEAFKMILNYYIRKINQNNLEFVPKVLDYYKKGLELKLLFEDGYLSKVSFSNITAMALQVGDTEWVADFIESYKPFLRKDIRKETYSLNKARLEHKRKNYGQALELLADVNYSDLFYAVTARILQIKIYWETSERELLDHHLHSLKFFLKRKKVVGYHYRMWSDSIAFIRKLDNLNPYDKEKIEQFKQEVREKDVLMERAWLLEQLDRL